MRLYAAAMVQSTLGKNNLKPDVVKLGACAFLPCPMATCALKCVVVSAINLFAVVEYLLV